MKESDLIDDFKKENPIIFKKYHVKRKIGFGAFGDIYLGQAIQDNKYVAIKTEIRKIPRPILETEAYLLYNLKAPGIPEVLSFGHTKNYNVLIETLLGKSLDDIFCEKDNKFSKEDICLITKQVIDRIQWVHSKMIIHRDVKPANFLIGKTDPNIIYLIDFGLSKKYRSSITNNHIRFGFAGKLTGTVRFCSVNALKGLEQSRRDDIESIAYMMIYFFKGKLPWQGLKTSKKTDKFEKVYEMKKNISIKKLCENLPEQVEKFLEHAKGLGFEQEPDYSFLRSLCKDMINGKNFAKLNFSWVNPKEVDNLKNDINPISRKNSPFSRLYKKIYSNLIKKKVHSSSSDSKLSEKQKSAINLIQNNNYKIKKVNNIGGSSVIEKEENNTELIKKIQDKSNTMITNLDEYINPNLFTKSTSKIPLQNKENNEQKISRSFLADMEKKTTFNEDNPINKLILTSSTNNIRNIHENITKKFNNDNNDNNNKIIINTMNIYQNLNYPSTQKNEENIKSSINMGNTNQKNQYNKNIKNNKNSSTYYNYSNKNLYKQVSLVYNSDIITTDINNNTISNTFKNNKITNNNNLKNKNNDIYTTKNNLYKTQFRYEDMNFQNYYNIKVNNNNYKTNDKKLFVKKDIYKNNLTINENNINNREICNTYEYRPISEIIHKNQQYNNNKKSRTLKNKNLKNIIQNTELYRSKIQNTINENNKANRNHYFSPKKQMDKPNFVVSKNCIYQSILNKFQQNSDEPQNKTIKKIRPINNKTFYNLPVNDMDAIYKTNKFTNVVLNNKLYRTPGSVIVTYDQKDLLNSILNNMNTGKNNNINNFNISKNSRERLYKSELINKK